MSNSFWDKAAHVFYGMDPDYYDAGFRYDWSKATHETKENDNIVVRFPILRDGQPFVIKCDRPNTMGTLTGIKP